jgi:hypothetical protein
VFHVPADRFMAVGRNARHAARFSLGVSPFLRLPRAVLGRRLGGPGRSACAQAETERSGLDKRQQAVVDRVGVRATAQRRHNRSLTMICGHLEDIGALCDDVDARLARRIITYYYGIDGLLRTRDVFGWSLERSNKWLLAHASAAILRSPPEPLSPN